MDKTEYMKLAIESVKESCEKAEMHLKWTELDIGSLCNKIITSNLTDQQIGAELRGLVYRRNDCIKEINGYKEYIELTEKILKKSKSEDNSESEKPHIYKPVEHPNDSIVTMKRHLWSAMNESLIDKSFIGKIPEPTLVLNGLYEVIYEWKHENRIALCNIGKLGGIHGESWIILYAHVGIDKYEFKFNYTHADIIRQIITKDDNFKKDMYQLWTWFLQGNSQ